MDLKYSLEIIENEHHYRAETNDRYCDWLIERGYDPSCAEEDDQCYASYLKERRDSAKLSQEG